MHVSEEGGAVPEEPDVEIGGLHRIAFDRRPPASRQSQKATGDYAKQQPHHQRVRIHDIERLGLSDEREKEDERSEP